MTYTYRKENNIWDLNCNYVFLLTYEEDGTDLINLRWNFSFSVHTKNRKFLINNTKYSISYYKDDIIFTQTLYTILLHELRKFNIAAENIYLHAWELMPANNHSLSLVFIFICRAIVTYNWAYLLLSFKRCYLISITICKELLRGQLIIRPRCTYVSDIFVFVGWKW